MSNFGDKIVSLFGKAGEWLAGEVLDPLGLASPVKKAGKWVSEKVSNATALRGVDADVKDAAKTLISTWNELYSESTGATAYIYEGKRSKKRQERLIAEGRSTCNLAAGHCKHVSGLAVDVWFWDNEYNDEIAPDDAPWDWYEALGEIGEELGFTWGGHWVSLVDKPHFEA